MKLLADVFNDFTHDISSHKDDLTSLILLYNQKITKDIAYSMLLNQLAEYLGLKVVMK